MNLVHLTGGLPETELDPSLKQIHLEFESLDPDPFKTKLALTSPLISLLLLTG